MSLQTISPKDADDYIRKSNTILIDLRTPNEYNRGHIPGAVNLEFTDVDETVMPYPKSVQLILYCSRGNSSLKYGRYLCDMGYNVINIYGGIHAYKGKLSVD